jgi:hypothetical protein
LIYGDSLNEEIFFFLYHLKLDEAASMSMVVWRRKWMIQRFIEQKRKENDEIERTRSKKK